MALIKCVECGKEISDKAIACTNCGCPVSATIKNMNETKVEKEDLEHSEPITVNANIYLSHISGK